MAIPIFRKIYLKKTYQRFFPFIKHKKTASYFTITLSFFTLAFFGLFAIRPTLKTAFTLVKNVSDLKELNVLLEKKISNIINAQVQYEQIRADLPLIKKAIPSNPTFQNLARALEKFATNSGVILNQLQIDPVSISDPPPDDKLHEYNFSLIAIGSYDGMSSYIEHITNWQRIANINSLEITREGGTESGNLRISLKGETYYEP